MDEVLHHVVGSGMPVDGVGVLLILLQLFKSLTQALLQLIGDDGVRLGDDTSN